jgi:uncharacterized SAM-binding protein YcdF (DUF218 family)
VKYLIKQFVGVLATPLAVAILLAALAVILRALGRRSIARWVCVTALVLAYLGALPPVGNALLASLEWRYPPLREDQHGPPLAGIVVLGSGYSPRRDVPVTGTFSEDGLARIAEGVRLSLRFAIRPLVVSGGAPAGVTPSALGYARFARELGVPNASIVILDRPLDTNQEAHAVAQLLGDSRFLLVTSASHMPRAMLLMKRAGAQPVAAPTGHRTGGRVGSLWHNLIPSAGALRSTELALHEYLGLAAVSLELD